MKATPAMQIRVGLLVLTSLAILGIAILMMGKERRLFEKKVPFEIHFSRAVGLRQGAPVNLSGVTVGSVDSLTFPQDIRENYVVVTVRVVGDVAPRIRRDTVARIRTQGVLGDKFIELMGGSSRSEPLPPGSLIPSVDPVDYEGLLGEGGDLIQNFIEVTSSLKSILKSIEEGKGVLGQLVSAGKEADWAETARNLRSASASLKGILRSVEKGEGILGQLVGNKESGEQVVEDLRIGLHQFRRATESLQHTAEKIEKGQGTLGVLIQDPDSGREILTNLRRSAANLEAITRQFRDGGGMLQRLMTDRTYGERVLGNLEQTTKDLSLILAKIERGEGTIGALVNDPELYKETKELVGTARRSWVFSVYRFFNNLFSSGENLSEKSRPDE